MDEKLRVWDLETGACLRTEGMPRSSRILSLTPDGRRTVSESSDNMLRVRDLETGACLRTLEGHTDSISSVSVTPNGRRAVSGSRDKTLRVWDLETGVCLALVRCSAPIESVAFSFPLNRLVAGSSTGEVTSFSARGIDWDRPVPPPEPEGPERQLRAKPATSIRSWSDSHPYTLLTEAARLLGRISHRAMGKSRFSWHK